MIGFMGLHTIPILFTQAFLLTAFLGFIGIVIIFAWSIPKAFTFWEKVHKIGINGLDFG